MIQLLFGSGQAMSKPLPAFETASLSHLFSLILQCGDAGTKLRAEALPKRGAAMGVNAARLGISERRLAGFA
jgi:hypothetical protein